MHWILLAAETGTGASPPAISEWIQLINIPLSIMIIYGFARGWFITGKEHQRVVDERDKERVERIEAQKALTEKVLPALQDSERAMEAMVKAAERLDANRGRRT